MGCGVGVIRKQATAGGGSSVVRFNAVPRGKAIVGFERGFFGFCFWSFFRCDDFRGEFLESDSFFIYGALPSTRSKKHGDAQKGDKRGGGHGLVIDITSSLRFAEAFPNIDMICAFC